MKTNIGRSFSPDYLRLLDGIDLSSEVTSIDGRSPSDIFPHLSRASHDTDTYQESRRTSTPVEEPEISERNRRSSTSSALRSAQWVPQASPPETMLGVVISENEGNSGTASEAESGAGAAGETLSRSPVATIDDEIAYAFSPDTVPRRKMLLCDIPSSNDDDDDNDD